jgi:hypothetical protein
MAAVGLQHPSLANPLSVLPRAISSLQGKHPLFDQELTALRTCLSHQAPFAFTDLLAQFIGVTDLDSTLCPRDQPHKTPD